MLCSIVRLYAVYIDLCNEELCWQLFEPNTEPQFVTTDSCAVFQKVMHPWLPHWKGLAANNIEAPNVQVCA